MFGLFVSAVLPPLSRAQIPVFEIPPVESSVKFDVEAPVAIKGTVDKWGATLTFASPGSKRPFWILRFRPTVWIPEAA
jgi:hypothetical protein